MQKIAKVVVELALNKEFDYRVPDALASILRVGSQVVVPFGHSEARGYIVGFSEGSTHKNLKEIRDQVGKKPLIEQQIMDLAKWIADYYAAPIERAVRTVLPSAVRKKGAGFKERLMVFPTELASDVMAIEQLRKKAPKQAAVLDVLLTEGQMFLNHLAKAAGTTSQAVRALEQKGIVTIGRQAVLRDPHAEDTILKTQSLELMPTQLAALQVVEQSVDTLDPPAVLLYGVTGSGKTEVYMQGIRYARNQGKGAIVLVPEIALTPQTVERFRGRFGNDIAVLHSNLSEGERHDEWHRIHDGKANIVIGARSALFAPVQNLGLIVVDEEHEHSYKQEEEPRYNARDVAVMRGRMEKCSVVLGSATPSIESYNNAQNGKYKLVHLPGRVDHRKMPTMRVVDMRVEMEKEGRLNVLSRDLMEAIRLRLDRAEQTMLFLNRRGFSTSLICPKCGHVVQCDQCSLSMTFHKQSNRLSCHMCGSDEKVPPKCPACRDPSIRYAGVGTQRVEEVVGKLFPHAKVQRMDADTTTQKDSYRRILGDFRTGKIDILVGTQMIAKGLHFPNVTLVGVIYADLTLHMPDFRAGERTFQLLTQVAGRAGRGDVAGEVIVQTFTPFHPAIQASQRLDYEGFCEQELEFRRELSYPPFTHLVCINLRGPSEELVELTGETFKKQLKDKLPKHVIIAGPTPAPIAKIKGLHRQQIILRAPYTKTMVVPLKELLQHFKWPDKVTCQIDVDALSLL